MKLDDDAEQCNVQINSIILIGRTKCANGQHRFGFSITILDPILGFILVSIFLVMVTSSRSPTVGLLLAAC